MGLERQAGTELLEAPGPPAPSAVFGHLKQLQGDALGTLMGAFRAHGDVAAFRFGPVRALLLAHPEHVQHVLMDHHANYDKRIVSYRRMKTLLGEGLLTSEGDLWRRQRRIAQPAFHRGRIVPFGEVMVRAAEDTVASWLAGGGRRRADRRPSRDDAPHPAGGGGDPGGGRRAGRVDGRGPRPRRGAR